MLEQSFLLSSVDMFISSYLRDETFGLMAQTFDRNCHNNVRMCNGFACDCSCSCTCVENVSDLNDCSQWNKNVLGCLEQHDLLVLAFFTPCKVVKLCLSEARINFKNISSFSRQLCPLAKTVYPCQTWSSFATATQFATNACQKFPALHRYWWTISWVLNIIK